MPTVNFYLKKPDGDPPRCLIYLQSKFNGKKLVFSFGQKIEPADWDSNKQKVKSNKKTINEGLTALNDLMENLRTVFLRTYNELVVKGYPNPDEIKKRLSDYMGQNDETLDEDKPTLFKLFDRFISGEIGGNRSRSTIQNYETLLGHLKEFQAINKTKVDFEEITLDFKYKFVSYLANRSKFEKQVRQLRPDLKNVINLSPNTVAKDVNILKTVMAEAVDLGYTNNTQFRNRKFSQSEVSTEAVYLKTDEIIRLFRFDFSDNSRLEKVRDLFVFGCFVGFRKSDYGNINPSDIIEISGELYIKKKTKKTGEWVTVPCHPIVLEIFEKYKANANRLPDAISDQRFNDYIKEACKIAGFNEKGRLRSEPEKELWECISSHTARRSTATNLYLEGFPTIDIMKITGHRTEAAFMKYIKITNEDAAIRLAAHQKTNWEEKLKTIQSI